MESYGETNDPGFTVALAQYAEDKGITLGQWATMSGVSVFRIRQCMENPLCITLDEAAALANSLGISIALTLCEGNPEETLH